MRMTIAQKLALGTASVLLLMTLSAGVAYYKITELNQSLTSVTDRAFPAVTACNDLLNGLNHSVASLRGYILLGSDPRQAEFFAGERLRAWETIEPAAAKLAGLYEQSDGEAKRQLVVVQSNLNLLRQSQQEVEELAHRTENIAAYQQLRSTAIPHVEQLIGLATAIMDADATADATDERRVLLRALADFRSSLGRSLASVQAFLIAGDARFKQEFETHWRVNQLAMSQIDTQSPLLSDAQRSDWDRARLLNTEVEPVLREIDREREKPDWNRASFLVESQTAPRAALIRTALEDLKRIANTQMLADRERLDAASAAVVVTLVTATLLALVVGATISILLSRKIVASVKQLVAAVQAVTSGDLTEQAVHVVSDDEIGQLTSGFNNMVQSLRGLLAEAATMSNEAATASHQIATSSQQQVASLNQTATSLNQITTAVEEFKSTMLEFSDRARAVQAAADETTKLSAGGRSLTQESASRIEQVRENSRAAGRSVLGLSEQMQRIGEITATVNEIAEQTKLLALNASIEAARAGDDGRGFAVVATQVRELANQSKQSAVRIESLISDAQRSMHEVAGKIEEGSHLSDGATGMVRQMTQSFEEIARAVEQTRDAMVQISTAAGEQELGISELASSITEIDSGSKESLAAAEQTQQSIFAIDQRIRALNLAVARFKT